MYTTMDMVRNFFPATDLEPCKPQFYDYPPIGYALLGFPHVGYVLVLEWVGILIVSPITQPFLIGSPEHQAAMRDLPIHAYADPVTIPDGLEWHAGSCPDMENGAVVWSCSGGLFRKRIRAGAHNATGFGRIYRVYSTIAPLLAVGPSPAALPRNVRLLYGAHEVLVEMEFIEGSICEDSDVLKAGDVLDCVARAIVWLARHCVVYVDLRGGNVIRRPPHSAATTSTSCVQGREEVCLPCATLVDFDDAIVVANPIETIEAFDAVITSCAATLNTFATIYTGGGCPDVRSALVAAFGNPVNTV
jgi:hypothetical protein